MQASVCLCAYVHSDTASKLQPGGRVCGVDRMLCVEADRSHTGENNQLVVFILILCAWWSAGFLG